MMSIAGVFVIALAAVLVLTPLARWAAATTGIVDHADGKRKLHSMPMPLLGGVAVYLAYAIGVESARWFTPSVDAQWWLVSAGLICLVGWCDDVWRLAPRWKLLGQTLAALPIVATEWPTAALAIGGEPLELGWWGAPFVLLWVLACVNALNFLDGVDGLAASCGMVAAAFLATIAQSQGQFSTLYASVALCGALGGFLAFNVAPAKIYLGDAGSMMIGLSLAVLSLNVFQSPSGAIEPFGMAVLLAVPLLDVVLAITRRTLSGCPFWQADRFHIHHRLLERGCSAHETTALMAGLCVLAGFAAAMIAATGAIWPTLVAGVGVLLLLVRGEYAAHHEWLLVKRRLARLLVSTAARLGEQSLGMALPEFEELAGATDDANWRHLERLVVTPSIARIDVQAGQGTALRWQESLARSGGDVSSWSMRLEFPAEHDGWCRMHVRFTEYAATHPWQVLEILATLRHFGQYWSERQAMREQEFELVPFQGDRRAA
jgi:UDP-GlcNAc:undecaprenyl-phosphate GlcNAc-1-phosphate transferase